MKSTAAQKHLWAKSTMAAWITVVGFSFFAVRTVAQGDGFLIKDGQRLFPIGIYELPKEDEALREMADAGINLVRCHSLADLDRAAAVDMMGWMPLPLQSGATDKLAQLVKSVQDHPALAVWEGPDEIVWGFTAYSGLYRTMGVYESPDEWWRQTARAVQYAEKRASEIMPKIREAIQLVRKIDQNNRQIWFNEALRSDVKFVREYIDYIDITGCDIYPVRKEDRRVSRVGSATERWKQVGRGKPVWMVLQAFAWSELGEYYGEKVIAYPTFPESRFMAYDVIVHGARGILYWGSHYLKSEAFRRSLYALTSELASLQSFLVAPEEENIRVNVIPGDYGEKTTGVIGTARRTGRDWLIILVNEDKQRHMGVEVTGLDDLNGQSLEVLYGDEKAAVQRGSIVTRMQPLEVKLFATSRRWETSRRDGRDFRD